MLNRPLFREFFVLLVVIGVLNYFANDLNWYWSFRSFDSFMHFLGGALSALFFLWLYFYTSVFSSEQRNLVQFLLISILGAGLIAVAWEIYELLLGEVQFNGLEYSFDTTLDFVMDFLGALAAFFFAYL